MTQASPDRPFDDLRVLVEWFDTERLPPPGSSGDDEAEDDGNVATIHTQEEEVIDLEAQVLALASAPHSMGMRLDWEWEFDQYPE